MKNIFNEMIEEDLSLEGTDLLKRYEEVITRQEEGFEGGNIMLFNEQITEGDIEEIKKLSTANSKKIMLTLLASVDRIDSYKKLERLHNSGIRSIKFHSYQQEISAKDYDKYITISTWAEELNMPIWIDCSYGSSKMLKYDNIELLIKVADKVKEIPIIALHSGGARILETLLIAESFENIILDTSLSLPYYINSSIENDLAFTYKKIGCNRVIYGSDQPYVNAKESFTVTSSFLKKYEFDANEIEKIMYSNLESLMEIG